MNTKIRAILGLATVSMLIYTTYEQNKTINVLKEQVRKLEREAYIKDLELFVEKANVGSYEMSLDILKERDPKAGYKFEKILKNETE